MTLLDFYGGETQDPQMHWNGAVPGVTTPGRGGVGASWRAIGGGAIWRRYTPSAHVFVGAAMGCNQVDGVVRPMMCLTADDSTLGHLTVGFSANAIVLHRGAGAGPVMAQTSMGFVANTYYYVEVEATMADSGGICKVRVNGNEVINFTGDTRNGGVSTNFDGTWFASNGGLDTTIDDYYVCNDQGAAPANTFLGDVRIGALRPSGAGNTTGFTPDSGANWTRVNETPWSAAQYVAATAAAKDTYAMGDLASGLTVLGVRAAVVAKNPDGGSPSIRTVLRSGGTDYTGTARALGMNDSALSTMYDKNPATTAAWTVAEVNGIEVGVERV